MDVSRDLIVVGWLAVVLSVFSGLTLISGVADYTAPALILGPNPWLGMVLSIGVAAIVSLPAWQWAAGQEQIDQTSFGLRWRPQGTRQLARAGLAMVSGYVGSMLAWLFLSSPRVVDLAPFGVPDDVIATCSNTLGVPDGALWAVEGMCTWSDTQVAPFAVGSFLVMGVVLLAWLSRENKVDIGELRFDSAGLTVETELGERRFPWTEVESARLVDDHIVVSFIDGSHYDVPKGTMADYDAALMVEKLRHYMAPAEVLSAQEKARLKSLSRLSD